MTSRKTNFGFQKESIMREMMKWEISAVAGGMNCIDTTTFQKIQNKAINDGIIFSFITTALIGSVAFGLTSSVVATGGVGLLVAPYAAGIGYFYSSTWNTFYA